MRNTLFRLSKHIMPNGPTLIERELSVQAPWGKIAALTWGEPGNKPVLLCHGKIDSAATFRPLVQLLPRNYYYIGIEFPGNGRSDHLPKGVPLSVPDFVPSIRTVVEHLQLKKFLYIGHSLGSHVGKYYHIAYPNDIVAAIDLDPIPAYSSHEMDTLDNWYHYFYGTYFSKDNYSKYNADRSTAPTYTREQALELMMQKRGLTREAAEIALERTLEPAGDGVFRFTFDQRMKIVMRPPFSSRYLRDLYTSIRIPTLCILASWSLESGWYAGAEYISDAKFWGSNYSVTTVEGGHDVHLTHPELFSQSISTFLNKEYLADRGL